MTRTETLTISGMSCGHCVAAVRSALEAVDPRVPARAVEEEGYAVRT